MSIQQDKFDLLVEQRYYHFIALHVTGSYSLTDYWSQLHEFTTTSSKMSELTYSDLEIQHRRLRSDIPYTRGKLLETVSISGNGLAPYDYDIFALRMSAENQTYFMFAFPFVALGRLVIDNLIANHDFMKKGDTQKVDLGSLVKQAEVAVENLADPIRTRVVGLQVVILTDPALSTVSLDGDNPLKSAIYRNYLQESIHKGRVNPNQVVLACELLWPPQLTDQTIVNQRKLRARIHMDVFGNFKFYVHIGGENCIIIPYLMKKLASLKCLDKVSTNPLRRTRDETE